MISGFIFVKIWQIAPVTTSTNIKQCGMYRREIWLHNEIVIFIFKFVVVILISKVMLISLRDCSSYHDSHLITEAVEKILFIHSSSPDPEGVHANIHG